MKLAGALRVQLRSSTTALKMFASPAPQIVLFAPMKQVADLVPLRISSPMAPAGPVRQTARIAPAQQTALYAELPISCPTELVVPVPRTARLVQAQLIALLVPQPLVSFKMVFAGLAPLTVPLVTMQPAAHHAAHRLFFEMEYVPAVQVIVAIAPVQLTVHHAELSISCPTEPVVRVHQTARIVQARLTALFVNRHLLSSKTVFAGLVLLIAQPAVMQQVVLLA